MRPTKAADSVKFTYHYLNLQEMKTYYLNIKSVLVVALLCGIFWSCQEESLLQDDLVVADDNFEIRAHNGYLWFKDSATYSATLEKLEGYSREELDQWEEELGFTSIRSIFEKAVDEDEKFFEAIEKLPEEEIQPKFANGIAPHSKFVLQNAELFRFNSEGWFDINLPYAHIHKLLNRDGIIRIGDNIMKYSSNAVKIIRDGDENKIGLLESIKKTDSKAGIKVNDIVVIRKGIDLENAKSFVRPALVNECTNKVDRYRVRMYENIDMELNATFGSTTITHSFEVHSFRHTYQGWQRRFKTSSLGGSLNFDASYGSYGGNVQAADQVHSLGKVLYTGQITRGSAVYVYYSAGQAWGRNGCYCEYAESYP